MAIPSTFDEIIKIVRIFISAVKSRSNIDQRKTANLTYTNDAKKSSVSSNPPF